MEDGYTGIYIIYGDSWVSMLDFTIFKVVQ